MDAGDEAGPPDDDEGAADVAAAGREREDAARGDDGCDQEAAFGARFVHGKEPLALLVRAPDVA